MKSTEKKKFTIALVVCVEYPFHKDIARILRDLTMNYSINDMDIRVFNTNLSQDSLIAIAKRILNDSFDLTVTIGMWSTVNIKKVFDQYGGFPHLFIAVKDPAGNNIVKSLAAPGCCTTGVIREPIHPLAAIKRLVKIAPYRKNILLPYTPWAEGGYLEEQVIQIKRYVHENTSLSIRTIPVESREEALECFVAHKGLYDCALILEGCLSAAIVEQIAKECWRQKVVLFASELPALELGAGCVMGGELAPYAERAFESVLSIYKDKINPGTIPVKVIKDNQRLIANTDMLCRVGMTQEEIDDFLDQDEVEVLRIWL
jgi:ABC-type uncharacterized transport system substrate-binding protein